MIVPSPLVFGKPFLTGSFPKYQPRICSPLRKQWFGRGFPYYYVCEQGDFAHHCDHVLIHKRLHKIHRTTPLKIVLIKPHDFLNLFLINIQMNEVPRIFSRYPYPFEKLL